jgi:hypothetical protein
MFKQKRLAVLSMAVLLALLVAAIIPFAAFADDGAPPPPDVPVVDVPPTDVPVAEAAPTDVPVVDEPVADTPVEDLTVPEVLDQVPAGTEVVVLDEGGQSVPLTSLTAADAILTSDPIWCPAGKKPGEAGCTAGYATVAELIQDLKGVTGLGMLTSGGGVVESGDGTIFFTSTYDTNDVTFNSSDLPSLGAFTIQGGWNGKTLGDFALSGVTTFSKPVTINWDDKTVTINDIKITGVIGPMMITPQVALATGTGLTVTTTTGDIVLNHVESDNNALYGIDIKSGSVGPTGVIPGPTTGGNVSLNDVIANGNGATGVRVQTPGALSVVSGHFNNNKNDHINGGYGLSASAKGGITLRNVTANFNESSGASLNTFSSTNGPTVYCSHFGNNTEAGINAAYENKLTLNGVTFASNGSFGDIYIGTLGTVVRNDAYDCSSTSCGESGSGGEDFRNKNKDTDTSLPQVIAVPTPVKDSELPGALPEGKTFAAGTNVKLVLGGEEIDEWLAGVQVFLDIPAGMQPPISVLSWTGTEWVVIPSEIMDGKIVFTITAPGIFVLVTP